MKRTTNGKNKKKHISLKPISVAVRILLCFICSQAQLLGMPSTLGIAVLASAGKCAILCYLASVVGMLVFGTLNERIFYAAAITLVMGFKSLYSFSRKKIDPAGSVVFTAVGMTTALIIVSIFFELTAREALYCICSIFICCMLSHFAVSAKNRTDADGMLDINGTHGISLAVLYVAVVSLLTSLEVFGFNAGRIFGAVVLLCAATKYKHIGGAVCGALTTCGVLLCSVDTAGNTLLLATAGLICGAVSAAGSFAMVLTFLIASIMGLVIIGVTPDTFNMLKDVALASVLYSCMPGSFVRKLLNYVGGETNAVSIVGQAASSRLNFASRTLSGIRGQLNEIAEVIRKKSAQTDIQTLAGNKVCLECGGCKTCWSDNSTETVNAFTGLEDKVEKVGEINSRDVVSCLPKCRRPADLTYAFNSCYQEKLYEYSNGVRAGELREVVTQQLSAMEDILSDLSHRISQMSSVDPSLSEKVRSAAVRLGCRNAKACVSCDENKNYRAELFIPNLSRVDIVKLTVEVSDILDIDMELPTASSSDGVTKLTFTPMPEYKIDVGIWQSSSNNDIYCGDTVERVELNSCEEYVVLSDGMGTGKRAKLDSMLASGLARKLLKAGISCQTGMRMINSVMRVKGWEESFSTIDIAHFDLRRGICEFVKAGAAASFLVRDETIRSFTMDSLPLGILAETDISSERVKLFDRDIIILASDGIGSYPEKAILSAAMSEKGERSDTLAAEIGKHFVPENGAVRRDDITVAVIKVCSAVEHEV